MAQQNDKTSNPFDNGSSENSRTQQVKRIRAHQSWALIAAGCLLFFTACNPAENDVTTPPFQEDRKMLVPLYTLADKREADSVISYLYHANPILRKRAALALSSWEKLPQASVLTDLYSDNDAGVRAAAYYASGQVQCEACVEKMMNRLIDETDTLAIRELYEGIGKIGRLLWDARLDSLSNASAPHREGAAWHLYRCTLRGDIGEGDLERAFDLLNTCGVEGRLGIAHFLGRSRDLDLTSATSQLEAAIESEESEDVRLGLIAAVRHLNPVFAKSIAEDLLDSDQLSPLERVNALRVYGRLENHDPDLISKHITHSDEQVRQTADAYLSETDPDLLRSMRADYRRFSRDAPFLPHVEGAFHKANGDDPQAILDEISLERRSYHRASLVAACRDLNGVEESLVKLMKTDSAAIVRTTAAEMLIHRKDSESYSGSESDWESLILETLASGDLTAMGMMAEHINGNADDYKTSQPIADALQTGLEGMTLPRDFEAAVSLRKTIATLNGEEVPEIKPHWNHPTDWERWTEINYAEVSIQTSKGSFTIQLDFEGAPTAALNFLELSESGYFDGKAFHRVVPNFVIQTGCPRGDGWGSTNYTLRSDFGPHRYRPGAVGMASLGADTESCQWFVTHSSTPHLEGRYTVFGRVTQGMDVVQRVSVGDRIEKVSPKIFKHGKQSSL